MGGDQLFRHAENPRFGTVGISDVPFDKNFARAGHIGDAVGKKPPGAGFGAAEQPAPGGKRLADFQRQVLQFFLHAASW